MHSPKQGGKKDFRNARNFFFFQKNAKEKMQIWLHETLKCALTMFIGRMFSEMSNGSDSFGAGVGKIKWWPRRREGEKKEQHTTHTHTQHNTYTHTTHTHTQHTHTHTHTTHITHVRLPVAVRIPNTFSKIIGCALVCVIVTAIRLLWSIRNLNTSWIAWKHNIISEQ